ncbi:hypothetical protein GA0074704_3946 [Micromonospora siamensis]|uniref:Uncharacterized protein n=1 Tax=Micromonospora siamensis TaxID=299152 RepID=A0A1C5IYU3_9ACTN|nr:hypothetical protein GA0074704_3946 [Micromonospora siamensis]
MLVTPGLPQATRDEGSGSVAELLPEALTSWRPLNAATRGRKAKA